VPAVCIVTSHGEAEFWEANSSGRTHGLASGYNRYKPFNWSDSAAKSKAGRSGQVIPPYWIKEKLHSLPAAIAALALRRRSSL
jgi:hypothetical protein